MNILAENISRRRKELKMTQKQLAEFQQYYPLDDAARDDFITTMALFIPSVDR